MTEVMNYRWNDSIVLYAGKTWYRCPGYREPNRRCVKRFETQRGLERHMKIAGHAPPYFLFGNKHVTKASATCEICGFVPAQNVDNPIKCKNDHMRRQHRLEYIRGRRPYVISEEP